MGHIGTGLAWAGESGSLIPRLPDDVTMLIFQRVPRGCHATCQLVARAWRAAFRGEELHEMRRAGGFLEEWLHVWTDDPDACGELYDPRGARWQPLPPRPADPEKHSLCHSRCVAVGTAIYVIGGVDLDVRSFRVDDPSPSARVDKYDTWMRTWTRVADMHHARGSFACVEMGGQIYVAGGSSRHSCTRIMEETYPNGEEAYDYVEVYSPKSDTWRVLCELTVPRAECQGAVLGGKLHVLGGYQTAGFPQGRVLPADAYHNDCEIYDPESDSWTRLPQWHVNPAPPPSVANPPRLMKFAALEDGGQLYALMGGVLLRCSPRGPHSWRVVGAPDGMGWDASAAGWPNFFSLAGELYVFHKFPKYGGQMGRCHKFSPATGLWSELAMPREGRGQGTLYNCKWACSCLITL